MPTDNLGGVNNPVDLNAATAAAAQAGAAAGASAAATSIANGNLATTPQVTAMINGNPLPIRYSFKGSELVVGTNTLWINVASRTLNLEKFCLTLESLAGLGAGLTFKFQKNGVDIVGASISFTTAGIQTVTLPPNTTVAANDVIRLVLVGVGVVVAGVCGGYLTTTS